MSEPSTQQKKNLFWRFFDAGCMTQERRRRNPVSFYLFMAGLLSALIMLAAAPLCLIAGASLVNLSITLTC